MNNINIMFILRDFSSKRLDLQDNVAFKLNDILLRCVNISHLCLFACAKEHASGTRKRKRKIAPLKFEEDPLDATFYSPDRPRAVPNPIGAPAVDVLGQTNSWVGSPSF